MTTKDEMMSAYAARPLSQRIYISFFVDGVATKKTDDDAAALLYESSFCAPFVIIIITINIVFCCSISRYHVDSYS